jgi:hypothetical protein
MTPQQTALLLGTGLGLTLAVAVTFAHLLTRF